MCLLRLVYLCYVYVETGVVFVENGVSVLCVCLDWCICVMCLLRMVYLCHVFVETGVSVSCVC